MPTSRTLLRFAALTIAAAASTSAAAQNTELTGKWVLALDSSPRAGSENLELRVLGLNPSADIGYGILEIIESDDEWQIYIDGGPVNLLGRDGRRIRFDFDWTDSGDVVHVTELTGEFEDGTISGTTTEDGQATGVWIASPWAEHPEAGKAPDPIDLSGLWLSLSRGTHKDSFDLTPTGEAVNSAYDPTYDDPHLRCVTGGVIRMEDGPFGYEILQRSDHLLILYEYFHEVRRVWTDGRDFPAGIDDAYLSMGYSIGHWEGSTLVIETRGMKPTVWDASGMPTSASAVVMERKFLDADARLHTDYTLSDPVNYKRPVYRHAYRERSDVAELGESSCDPHSFYRALDLEDRLGEYWTRSGNRF